LIQQDFGPKFSLLALVPLSRPQIRTKNVFVIGSYDYPRSHRIFELCSIAVFTGLTVFATYQTVGGIYARALWPSGVIIPVAILAGFAAADLISGIVHFLLDNFGSPTTPIIGAKFVQPFREHHDDPLAMTRGDFVAVNGDNIFVCLPLAIPMALFLDMRAHPGIATFLLALQAAVVMTNQFHKWAHLHEASRPVQWCQSHGIVLSEQHHSLHHSSRFDRNYCITWGKMDVVLNLFVGGWHRRR
jgi:plasmanylethanolamine desaturase